MAIECPKCKSQNINESDFFQFSLSTCFDCGYEYYLNFWYRLGILGVFWSLGVLYLVFKYLAPKDISNVFALAIIGITLLVPFAYWITGYYKFRDIPMSKGINPNEKIIFVVLTLLTFIPAIIYAYGR